MEKFVKTGAKVAVVLLATPFALILSNSPFLLLPVWMLATFGLLRLLPTRPAEAVAVAVSIMAGQVAFRVMLAFNMEVTWAHLALTGALLASMAWLVVAASRWAAMVAIATELVALAFTLPRLPTAFELMAAQGAVAIPALLASYLCPMAAAGLLVPFTLPGPRPTRTRGVFD